MKYNAIEDSWQVVNKMNISRTLHGLTSVSSNVCQISAVCPQVAIDIIRFGYTICSTETTTKGVFNCVIEFTPSSIEDCIPIALCRGNGEASGPGGLRSGPIQCIPDNCLFQFSLCNLFSCSPCQDNLREPRTFMSTNNYSFKNNL